MVHNGVSPLWNSPLVLERRVLRERGIRHTVRDWTPAPSGDIFRRARPPAGKGRCPSALPTGVPLDPVRGAGRSSPEERVPAMVRAVPPIVTRPTQWTPLAHDHRPPRPPPVHGCRNPLPVPRPQGGITRTRLLNGPQPESTSSSSTPARSKSGYPHPGACCRNPGGRNSTASRSNGKSRSANSSPRTATSTSRPAAASDGLDGFNELMCRPRSRPMARAEAGEHPEPAARSESDLTLHGRIANTPHRTTCDARIEGDRLVCRRTVFEIDALPGLPTPPAEPGSKQHARLADLRE